MDIELGLIEGYYGRPWSWEDRASNMKFLAGHGYRFYLYAPKADPHLRRLWREDHPEETARQIAELAGQCRAEGVRFGVGLSPSKIHLDFNAEARAALARKLAFFDEAGVEDLAILFDDMRGDLPDLARRQVEIVEWAFERSKASRYFVCPSYYTDDPVLDRVFGARPANYLEDLGAALDPGVHMFWTGEEVCARAFSVGHVERMATQLGRQPFIWDNYPVNDGERMSQYLHLRGFTGRPAHLAPHIAGHGVNPSLQPTLARIPALTLVQSYGLGDGYEYGAAMREAAVTVLGAELGALVHEDVLVLQDVGLDRLDDKAVRLYERYSTIDHPGAREIIEWLNGGYRITDAIIQEQSGD